MEVVPLGGGLHAHASSRDGGVRALSDKRSRDMGTIPMAREQGLDRVEISYVRFLENGTVRKPGFLSFE